MISWTETETGRLSKSDNLPGQQCTPGLCSSASPMLPRHALVRPRALPGTLASVVRNCAVSVPGPTQVPLPGPRGALPHSISRAAPSWLAALVSVPSLRKGDKNCDVLWRVELPSRARQPVRHKFQSCPVHCTQRGPCLARTCWWVTRAPPVVAKLVE